MPIEDTSISVPTYVYNADDTIQRIWDARGANSAFTYNGRHQVTHINYTVPSNNNAPDAIEAVSPTPSVDISYDAAGNRSLMTDGLGSVTYQFDTWSRLISETRYFSDIFTNYTIGYDYNLAGGLKKLTDPSGKTINYAFNSAGQTTGVTATGLDTTQLVSSMQYRAWGALKSATFGNNFYNLSMGYNSRLMMNHFAFTHSGNNQWGSGDFQYYADGLISFASSLADNKFDRSYSYDQAGRLSQALSGNEARGGTLADGPYNQSYQYDVWNNMSYRANRFWDQNDYYIPTYVNNRDQAWTYDLAGNPRNTNFTMFHKYDVASRQTHAHDSYGFSVDQNFDGDGQPGKRVETQPGFSSTIYYVRSTLLGGQVVSERHQEFNRNFNRSYVYVDGEQVGSYDATTGVTGFTLRNPVSGSGAGQELDPFGGYVGFEAPDPNATYYGLHLTDEVFLKDASPTDPGSGCTLDGVPFPCSLSAQLVNNNASAHAPLGSSYFIWGNNGWERHTAVATADDRFGYLPDGAILGDNGYWHYPRSDYGGRLPTGHLNLETVLALQPQQNPASGGQQLSQCLRDALRQFFPQNGAQGKTYSPVDDARFKSGIPGLVKLVSDPDAITLGLYDIHYNPSRINLNGGSSEALQTIIEEVAHTVQFIAVWDRLKPNPWGAMKIGDDFTGYDSARNQWESDYAYFASKGLLQNGDSYKNDVEKWAKNRTVDIMYKLMADPQLFKQGSVCGFDLINVSLQRPNY